MTATPFRFRRQLGGAALAALDQLVDSPQGQWWRDVLIHRDLILAIRDGTLNAYHRGASIFRIAFRDGAVVAQTHAKYLVRQRQDYATLAANQGFLLRASPVWSSYEGKATLDEMIAAARALAGVEKAGLHALIVGNPRVIDTEVAFRSAPQQNASAANGASPDDDTQEPAAEGDDADAVAAMPDGAQQDAHQDRLDAVTLEERDGQLWVVFHEAKHFINAELRAGPQRTPPVAAQIARYRATLQHHASDIATSYAEVCRALLALDAMRGGARQLAGASGDQALPPDPLVQRAAAGEPLHLDPEPRLIAFGFDQDQRDGPVWTRHHDRLKELGLAVGAIGRPQAGGAGAFARRASS